MYFFEKLVAHIVAVTTELEPRSTIRRSLSFARSIFSSFSDSKFLRPIRTGNVCESFSIGLIVRKTCSFSVSPVHSQF